MWTQFDPDQLHQNQIDPDQVSSVNAALIYNYIVMRKSAFVDAQF